MWHTHSQEGRAIDRATGRVLLHERCSFGPEIGIEDRIQGDALRTAVYDKKRPAISRNQNVVGEFLGGKCSHRPLLIVIEEGETIEGRVSDGEVSMRRARWNRGLASLEQQETQRHTPKG